MTPDDTDAYDDSYKSDGWLDELLDTARHNDVPFEE